MEHFLNEAIRASLMAGIEIMTVYNEPITVYTKEDTSPLTEADKRANDVIVSRIEQLGVPIISEENKQLDYSIRNQWQKCWIVDPLDGTKEFIKRNGEFTVNIALVENGKPVLGVIYVPDSKQLYFANVRQGKAYKAQLTKHDSSLEEVYAIAKPIAPKNDKEALRIVGSRSHLSKETQDYIDGLSTTKEKQIVSKGSSLKFCLIAEGLADVYPRFAPTMEWDTAAGQAICEAVGVTILAMPDYTPLQYNKKDLLNPWFLVTKN